MRDKLYSLPNLQVICASIVMASNKAENVTLEWSIHSSVHVDVVKSCSKQFELFKREIEIQSFQID